MNDYLMCSLWGKPVTWRVVAVFIGLRFTTKCSKYNSFLKLYLASGGVANDFSNERHCKANKKRLYTSSLFGITSSLFWIDWIAPCNVRLIHNNVQLDHLPVKTFIMLFVKCPCNWCLHPYGSRKLMLHTSICTR